jgi:phospho-N-acetylmuramoyl-pentapeptide-transferase
MTLILELVIISAILTLAAAVPFISLLYYLKFQRRKEVHLLSPIFTKLHAWKVGTPNSGGVLVILVVLLLGGITAALMDSFRSGGAIVFLSLATYGLLGLYDDIKKYFGWQKRAFWGMRLRYKLTIQIFLAVILGYLLFLSLNTNGVVKVDTIFFGSFNLAWWAYTTFAALTIVASANAFNITDGLDGLSSGLLSMSLVVLLIINQTVGNLVLGQIIAIWLGSILAFLYFNIYPARVWMGDSGALAFGATLAVVTLFLRVPFLLPIFGAIYVAETVSSLLQWYSMRFLKQKLFLIAPLHHHFEAKGWPETKVTMRFWLAGALASLVGLLVFFSSRGL